MSKKVTKKAVKKTAKKAVRKTATKTTKSEETVVGRSQPGESTVGLSRFAAEELSKIPKDPKEANKTMTALLSRLVGDVSRHENQIRYLSQQNHTQITLVNEALEFIQTCLHTLFDHLHLEMPKRTPKIVGAKVQLSDPEVDTDIGEGEPVVLIAYSTQPHPIRGHWDLIMGDESVSYETLHPIVREQIEQQFDEITAQPDFKSGKHYRARIQINTLGAVDGSSVRVGGE